MRSIIHQAGLMTQLRNCWSLTALMMITTLPGPPIITVSLPLVFSSNRSTAGGKFDLIDYELYASFNQYDGTN
jgi:hypothetical protein